MKGLSFLFVKVSYYRENLKEQLLYVKKTKQNKKSYGTYVDLKAV